MGSIVTLRVPPDLETAVVSKDTGRSPRMRFTEARIKGVPVRSGRPIYVYDLDTPGLALRVTPRGGANVCVR